MNKTLPLSAKSVSRMRITAIIGIALGLVAVILAIGFEWGGFGGGLVMGAGVGVMLISAYCWGYANGVGRPLRHADWRPSEDRAQ